MSLENLVASIQEEALPGIWSRGVALAREKAVQLDRDTPDEQILRVKAPGQTVSPKVSVWANEDDAHCDCGSKVEPCMHVVAAVVALKNGWAQAADVAGASGTAPAARLVYRFSEKDGALFFERAIVRASGEEEALRGSLVSLLGGISSGRISAPPVPATREDFKVDEAITRLEAQELMNRGKLERRGVVPLFTALKEIPLAEFEGKRASIDPRPVKLRATLEESGSGVKLTLSSAAESEGFRLFGNGAVLAGDTLRPLQAVSPVLLEANGREFTGDAIPKLAANLLPLLQTETELTVKSRRLPRVEKLAPRIVLETETDPKSQESMEVMARLVYGSPPIAEVIDGKIEFLSKEAIPERSEAEEQSLMRELQLELHLKPRQRIRLYGRDAIDFVRRSAKWEKLESAAAPKAEKAFEVRGELVPELQGSTSGLGIEFKLPGTAGATLRADPKRVFEAWLHAESLVPLIGGGWAKIPKDWLEKNGARVQRFMALRNPSLLQQYQVAEICAESEGVLSPDLQKLRDRLKTYEGIPEQRLPSDLRAELRPYQKIGVDWLGFLRDSSLGAILADDMGLGKTLQALCALRGRTLIVCPTSVLPAWEGQIREFRPGLRINLYYGQGRRPQAGADVTLTSYGTLRQDRALLTGEEWDTVILDEAQNIKNPGSQIAKIAHELRGKFRIALTGTPIENRLDDLWSQFQFIQPGLLGSRDEFQRHGDLAELDDLKRKIRPLILRRMKRDVAPELPPRTETVLYSTLSPKEQDAYRTVLAATREQVLSELESGGNLLGALEALLRLRQICAHPALVQGLAFDKSEASSKLELLRETLEESLDLGHNILIFSQWTSFLDLVGAQLASMGVEYLRLDGSTRDRAGVIDQFQDPSGPRVMVLSLKAGGVGLTLTRADHVIILDPWWNPAVEDQAADRAHRIGQTQPVLIQRLVARDTVEDRILELQKKKKELAKAVLGNAEGDAGQLSLTREELLELLR